MQIKEAAALCGLTEKAIRLYEEKGLIVPSYTEINGRKFRDYDEEVVRQLKIIAGLRQSFFSLEQIAAMQNAPEDIPAIFTEYRDELRGKYRALDALLSRADTIDPAALTSADALAQALDTALPAAPDAEIPTLPTDVSGESPYRIRRVETHAVPEMRFRVWDEDVDRDARESAYKRYLEYAKQWEKSYDTELKLDKIRHFWLYPVGKYAVLPLLCIAVIGWFLYFVGWGSNVDITYTGYEITIADEMWDVTADILHALPDGAKPHELDVSGFPQVVEGTPVAVRFRGVLTRYWFREDVFEGEILIDGYASYSVFSGSRVTQNTFYRMKLPGTIMSEYAIRPPQRISDRDMLYDCTPIGRFGQEDTVLFLSLLDNRGEGSYSSAHTYLVLGVDSPREASGLFWEHLWRRWQYDAWCADPEYYRTPYGRTYE